MGPPRLSARVAVARALAETLLAGVGERWPHTIGVAARAEHVSATVPAADREILLVAAWLHDIGYSPDLVDTGLHGLDGARYLDRRGWPRRASALVAHHSGAVFLAREQRLQEALAAFDEERSPVSDALTYADQTTGPDGAFLPVEERIAESLRRHGPDSVQARVRHVRVPCLRGAVLRVEQRMANPPPAGVGE